MSEPSPQNTIRVFVDEYHGETLFNDRLVVELRRAGYEVTRFTEAFTDAQLAEFDVYAVWFTRYRSGEGAEFTEIDREVIANYMRNGGGAFLIGLGWAWTDFEHRPSINEYPLNLLTREHGIFFTAAIIDSVAGAHYSEADITFFRPFMAEHPVTGDVRIIGSPDSAPASLLVDPPAEPLIWGSDETVDSDGSSEPIVLASSTAGQGKIVCLQHASYVSYLGYDNFTLLTNTLEWLTSDSADEMTGVRTTETDAPEFPSRENVRPIIVAKEDVHPSVGVITALPEEFAAMKAMLDNARPCHVPGRDGDRTYFVGEIPASDEGRHEVILQLITDMGNNIAAVHATQLLNQFPTVADIIMVGIAGGVPNPDRPREHVRLGDVIVSNRNGIVQYDFIKEEPDEIEYRHPPRPPRARLLAAVRMMQVEELEGRRPWLQHIERAAHLFNASRPSDEADKLHDFAYPNEQEAIEHPHDERRISGEPRVFTGPIASSNALLKNPAKRDALRDQFGVKAVEMEGSGIADSAWIDGAGYLVVRGICDYCDPEKTDDWQQYAAIVAAAFTRGLLESMPT